MTDDILVLLGCVKNINYVTIVGRGHVILLADRSNGVIGDDGRTHQSIETN